jgi:PAS domain S-box-containing protein
MGLYLLPLIAGVALSLGVAFFAWRRRHVSGALALALLMLAVAEWSAGYVLELTSASVPAKLFWIKVQYVGIVSAPLAWLAFALGYAGRMQWLRRRNLGLLALVPLMTVLVTCTNGQHHLMIRQAALDTQGPFPMLDLARGPWFWVHATYSYLLLFIGTTAFVYQVLSSPRVYRGQVIVLLIGALIPWMANALYILEISPLPNLDLTSFAFTLSGLVAMWALFRLRLLDVIPIAHDAVIEGMRDGVIVLDVQDRVVDLNPAAERIVGRSGAQAAGRPVARVVSGWLDVAERHRAATETQTEITLGEDEMARIYDLRISPLHDRRERLSGRLMILRDVTERKQAQEELHRRDAILEAVSFAAERFLRAACWEESIEGVLERLGRAAEVSRIYVFENQVWEDGTLATGQRHEWVAPGIAPQIDNPELQHIPMRASGFSRWEETLSRGELIHGHVKNCPPSECAFLSAQDILSIVVVPVFVGQTWWGFIGFDECVTPREWSVAEMEALRAAADTLGAALERKRAEEEREQLLARVQQQARQVQQIIDTVPEGVLLLDAERRIMLANPAAEKDLSTLAGVAVGEPLTQLGDHPLDDLLASPLTAGLWHEVKSEGRTFEVIARPMQRRSEPENWVLVVRDVTQEREVEQRARHQERLAAVGQLAAGVAHDFNNIMSTIALYAQMMSRTEDLLPSNREHLATINDQAKQASDLIEQILDFSRRSVIERQPLDLSPILKEQVKLLERTLPEDIQVDLTYGPGVHIVKADPTRIQQALTNLAINARDAMPDGGRLHVGLERVTRRPDEAPPLPEMGAGDWVRVTVSDTGEGIPPDVLPHVFEPFFTTKDRGRGTGLGLAQVHGIVKQHGGHIDVESRVGRGTSFTIHLPALPVRPAEPLDQGLIDLDHGDGETLLVVEDDPVARQALALCLKDLNYRVVEAGDGEEALEIVEHLDVTLVLSDVVMPRMGGVALLQALRDRGAAVPLILLTGHPLEEDIEGLRERGLSDWLVKPPDLPQLAEVVSRSLGR